ncbi:MAG: TPMT family class I SAM-dependent methyltransferase [Bacteroidetes bacterium]|nr:TPMT family class I SAM-dependent methyltransferase [Bacteroidota bacterium]
MSNHLNESYWETRWQNAETRWDLHAVSPPLAAYIDQIPASQRHLRILIPGCGNGYEAIYLLQKGFTQVTMLDIAPTAVEQLRRRLDAEVPDWQGSLRLICGDFFEQEGPYDLILEQTFFCALSPTLRRDYVLKMSELLASGGKLAGLLFDVHFEGGPPFGGHREEYIPLFEASLHILTMEPCYNSAAPRAGSELFFIAEKR